MTQTSEPIPRPPYRMVFLAGSFALTTSEAKAILQQTGPDRVQADDLARLPRAGRG